LSEGAELITGDTSKEAIAQRRLAEMQEMKVNLKLAEVGRVEDPEAILREFLSKPREPSEVVSEIRRLELTRTLDHKQKLKLLLAVLVPATDAGKIVLAFESKFVFFKPFIQSGGEVEFLCAVEQFVGETNGALMAKMPFILQALYVSDLVTEASIMEWNSNPLLSWVAAKGVPDKIRTVTQAFIEALRKAEEGDEESDK